MQVDERGRGQQALGVKGRADLESTGRADKYECDPNNYVMYKPAFAVDS
jgi:hypothetical protein